MEVSILESIYADLEKRAPVEEGVIIYGSAKEAIEIKFFLEKKGYTISFFLTSWDEQAGKEVLGIRIISLAELCNEHSNSIVILGSSKRQQEMWRILMENKFPAENIITLKKEETSYGDKICPCCNQRVSYDPLPEYYAEMKTRFGIIGESVSETINKEEYMCPICSATDRDRMIVSFLKCIKLEDSNGKLLQFAPAFSIENWISRNCKDLIYHSTDLYMEQVTFVADIQDMHEIKDASYDYFICSHVLEHVKDDKKAMRELYRILKEDGIGIFLVPLNLLAKFTDEEWGLSEAENWRRFGQGDHCRSYEKKDLIVRLQEAGFRVNLLGKDYFGVEVFKQCGLTDTSTLYILRK